MRWSPRWAPHVVGNYPPREFDQETQEWNEQRIDILCTKCGEEHRVFCKSGMAREHIARYAFVHAHGITPEGMNP